MRSKPSKFYLLAFVAVSIQLLTHLVFAQTNDQRMQQAKEYFAAGREFILQGNYAAADDEFKKAQQLLGVTTPLTPAKTKPEAKTIAAQTVKSKETVKLEEPIKDPVAYYIKAIKLAPKNGDLHYNLAVEYVKINEYNSAAEEFKRALQLNHRDKDASYNLGVLYENYLDDRVKAIYYYSRYLGLAPRADDVWRVRVWLVDLKRQIASEK